MSRSVRPNERTNVQLPVRPSSQSRRFSTPRQLRPAASIPGSLIRPLLLLLLAVLVLVVVPEIAWMLIDGRTDGRHAYRPSYTTTGRSMETYRSARSLHTGPAAENAGPFPSDSCPHPLKSPDSPVSDFNSDLTLIAEA